MNYSNFSVFNNNNEKTKERTITNSENKTVGIIKTTKSLTSRI